MSAGTTWVCGCGVYVQSAVDGALGCGVRVTSYSRCCIDRHSVMSSTHMSLSRSDGSGVFGCHGVRDQSYVAFCWVPIEIQCGC